VAAAAAEMAAPENHAARPRAAQAPQPATMSAKAVRGLRKRDEFVDGTPVPIGQPSQLNLPEVPVFKQPRRRSQARSIA
jgi:hypothetical protein